MGLFKTGANASTLSLMDRRTTKYQKVLNVSNVFLLITSTLVIFTAVILIKFYHVSKLDFWSPYFAIVPVYTIGLGVFTFIISFFGFAVSSTERSTLIAIYAATLGLAFLAQLGSVFLSLELRTTISRADSAAADINNDLSRYGEDPTITAKWDDLQMDMHCCGGIGFDIGYNEYRSTPIGNKYAVPDSCCHVVTEGCGAFIFKDSPEKIRNRIFTDGCLTLLNSRLNNDVVPMMVIYACIGVFLALLEIISIVISCAFVAQIRRRRRRIQRNWQAVDADMSREAVAALQSRDGTTL